MEHKKDLIIVVDDDITNLTVTRNNLSLQYDVLTAPSGKKLFQLLEKVTPALILLDIEMPEMNGYEVIQVLKADPEKAFIPIMFLTAHLSPESEIKGLDLGAVDYITKPCSKELLLKRTALHIVFEKQKHALEDYSHNLEYELYLQSKEVYELQNAILKTVADLVERRDGVTGGHIERTQKYLRILVDFLLEHCAYVKELLAWDIGMFVMSSQLHDVGKIAIHDHILMKPGPLTSEEFETMKMHTVCGVDIIKKIENRTTDNTFLEHAEILAGSHHEKWDGTGYPYGLKGYDIALQGRLMAIVDVYDALTNDRPYKKAFTHEQALEIIKNGTGTHFDPIIGKIFLMHEQEFHDVAKNESYFWDTFESLG